MANELSTMAKPNYSFEKRRKELEKKSKKEEKKRRKLENSQVPGGQESNGQPSGPADSSSAPS